MGIQEIGLPPAIFIGHSAQQAVEKLVKGYLSKGELRKDDYCLQELEAIAIEALSGLYEIALSHNNEKAAQGFVHVLMRGIRLFSERMPFRFQQPGYSHPIFRKLAEKANSWPGLLSVDRDQQKANQMIIAYLHLGENAPLNYKQRQWTRRTLEVRIALNLLQHREYLLQRNKRMDPHDQEDAQFIYDDSRFKRLRPLSRANYKVWWKAFETIFLSIYGKDFEKHKEFSGYWKSSGYRGRPNPTALIRRDIKKRIQQAFRSIAPKSPPM
ncbi:MAG: hypothetical protein JWR26_4116 [Pedosphaera sp.]|nr:hypothetical protein [Pedosphaera sp.]